MWNGVRLFSGGDGGDRTPGLYVANVPLSHLSYIPTFSNFGLRILDCGLKISLLPQPRDSQFPT